MYTLDGSDQIVEIDAPQCQPGAPHPIVVAEEGRLDLAYAVRDDFCAPLSKACTALVTFHAPHAVLFGQSGEETLEGHPLWAAGLRPYQAYEVKDSCWIRWAERVNAVHPRHRPLGLRHYIFAFHDSTFECLARGFAAEIRTEEITLSARTIT